MAEPALADEETEDDAGAILRPASLLGGLDDLGGDDAAVRLGDLGFVQVARDGRLDEVAQLEGDLGHLGRGDGGREVTVRAGMGGKN